MTKLQSEVGGFAPGVYLGIPNDTYHADVAVSSTGIKRLLKSTYKYWWYTPMNPKRPEDEETKATKFGHAYHTLILEPEKFDYKILYGQKGTSKEGCLGEEEYNDLLAMKAQIESVPEHAYAVKNGYPEVSVFWVDEETGVMCRCRFDYWKPGYVTDLKSDRDISDGAVFYSFGNNGYDVSGAMYSEGTRMLRKMMREGSCHIDPRISPEFIQKFLAEENERFGFLYHEKDAPFETRYRILSPELAEIGLHKFRRGLEIYVNAENKWGKSRWGSSYPPVEPITIDQVSSSINYR